MTEKERFRNAPGVWARLLAFGGWGSGARGALPGATEAEERANSLTGAVGLAASLVGLALLLDRPSIEFSYRIAAVVYGLTLVGSYAINTLYHAEPEARLKQRLRLLDHCAVYALIAGTYTPVALAGLGGPLGWAVLAAAWTLAGLGIAFKLRYRFRYPGLSLTFYLAMGWLVVPFVPRLHEAAAPGGFWLLVAGGAAFTLGTVLFGAKRLPHHHAAWHLLVLAGTGCHYAAIVGYLLPPGWAGP